MQNKRPPVLNRFPSCIPFCIPHGDPMDNAQLFQSLGLPLDAKAYTLGAPQQSGPMTVLPVFGPDAGAAFAPPLSGLKLGGVKRGYGNVELSNGMPGVAVVPLHMGYIQDGAQNHAL